MNKALPFLIPLFLVACSGHNISTFSCSIKSNVKDPNGDLIFEGNTGLLTLDKTNKRIGWKSDLSDDEYYMSENFTDWAENGAENGTLLFPEGIENIIKQDGDIEFYGVNVFWNDEEVH